MNETYFPLSFSCWIMIAVCIWTRYHLFLWTYAEGKVRQIPYIFLSSAQSAPSVSRRPNKLDKTSRSSELRKVRDIENRPVWDNANKVAVTHWMSYESKSELMIFSKSPSKPNGISFLNIVLKHSGPCSEDMMWCMYSAFSSDVFCFRHSKVNSFGVFGILLCC